VSCRDRETLRWRERGETVIQFAVDSWQLWQLEVDSYQFSVEFEVNRFECD
jgi:hypothetical protein